MATVIHPREAGRWELGFNVSKFRSPPSFPEIWNKEN